MYPWKFGQDSTPSSQPRNRLLSSFLYKIASTKPNIHNKIITKHSKNSERTITYNIAPNPKLTSWHCLVSSIYTKLDLARHDCHQKGEN
jgi:hypothetical protein